MLINCSATKIICRNNSPCFLFSSMRLDIWKSQRHRAATAGSLQSSHRFKWVVSSNKMGDALVTTWWWQVIITSCLTNLQSNLQTLLQLCPITENLSMPNTRRVIKNSPQEWKTEQKWTNGWRNDRKQHNISLKYIYMAIYPNHVYINL